MSRINNIQELFDNVENTKLLSVSVRGDIENDLVTWIKLRFKNNKEIIISLGKYNLEVHEPIIEDANNV